MRSPDEAAGALNECLPWNQKASRQVTAPQLKLAQIRDSDTSNNRVRKCGDSRTGEPRGSITPSGTTRPSSPSPAALYSGLTPSSGYELPRTKSIHRDSGLTSRHSNTQKKMGTSQEKKNAARNVARNAGAGGRPRLAHRRRFGSLWHGKGCH